MQALITAEKDGNKCGTCFFRVVERSMSGGNGMCYNKPPVPFPIQVQGVAGPQMQVIGLRPPVAAMDIACESYIDVESVGINADTMEKQR